MLDDAHAKPESVEVKRRRLRSALREARRQAQMTQHAAAEELSWSASKIVRIEQGIVPVAPTDVRAMLSLYGVTDQARIDELVTLAKQARAMKGFKSYGDVYSSAAIELFGSEASARSIHKFDPSVIPGLLQTQDYARALLIALGNSENVVERKLAARAERRVLLEHDDRPEFHFILGEAALCRPVGGLDVMREQLDELKRLSVEEGIYLYMLPFKAGPHRGLGITFTILQFRNPEDPDVLYFENEERVNPSRNMQEDVPRFLDLYVRLQEMAENADDFVVAIDEIIAARFAQELGA